MNNVLLAKLALEILLRDGISVERINNELDDSLVEDCLVHLKQLIDMY